MAVDLLGEGGVVASDAAVLLLRIETKNPLNSREHWRTVHSRDKREKTIVATMFMLEKGRGVVFPAPPVDVRLVRLGPWRVPMDEDGLAASMKHVRDQVSRELGVPNDGNKALIRFECDQEKGDRYRVRVEVRARRPA